MRLTAKEKAAIIPQLSAGKRMEMRQAMQLLGMQALAMLLGAMLVGIVQGAHQAAAFFGGGLVAILNVLMLHWRSVTFRAEVLSAASQLKMLYYYAIERIALVMLVLAVLMVLAVGAHIWVLAGFVAGQGFMLVGRLWINREMES